MRFMNRHFFKLISIILAGEAIFMLPFLIPRLYRPLMIEAWGVSNTQIGVAFSAYGITATLSYFFGGPIADKYHPRALMTMSLALTAMGGLFLSFFHSPLVLVVIYSFFGVSTTLLMWGALIRATHLIGGKLHRSSALGFLDGGRGLTAAFATSVLIFLVAMSLPSLQEPSDQLQALNLIYWTISGFCVFTAALLWTTLKDFKEVAYGLDRWTLSETLANLKNPQLWLLCLVVFSAYCGYKGIDNYSIYLVDVHHLSLKDSSLITSTIFWLRPLSAVGSGLLADFWHRKNPEARFLVLFLLLSLSSAAQLGLTFWGSSNWLWALTTIFLSSTFVYSLRAIYFSVFGDLKIPNHLIGTATGLVSLIGFLPEIFFAVITGHLIDSHPGSLGYQYTFLLTSLCLVGGSVVSFVLYQQSKPTANNL